MLIHFIKFSVVGGVRSSLLVLCLLRLEGFATQEVVSSEMVDICNCAALSIIPVPVNSKPVLEMLLNGLEGG